jgi:(2Fe-2S) ferredoxin
MRIARLAARSSCWTDSANRCIVLYPSKTWYCGVKSSDVEDIAGHAKGGSMVERLSHGVDPSLKELIFQLLDAGLF